MDTHMNLYVEHYIDLHNYINDKICNIGYSSELLLEGDSFITKTWNIAKASFKAMGKNLENVINFIKTIIFKWFKVVSLRDFEKISEENKKLNEKLEEQNNEIQKLKSVSDEKEKVLKEKIEEQKQKWNNWIKEQKINELKKMVQNKKDKFLTEFLSFLNKDATLNELIELTKEAKNESEGLAKQNYVDMIVDKINNKSNFEYIKDIQMLWSKLTFIKNAMLKEIKDILENGNYNALESLYNALDQLNIDKLNNLFDDFPNAPENILNNYIQNSNYILKIYNESNDIWIEFKNKINNYDAAEPFIQYIEDNHRSVNNNSTELVKNIFDTYIKESVDYFDEAKKKSRKIKHAKELITTSTKEMTKDDAKNYISKFNELENKFNNNTQKYLSKLKVTRELLNNLNNSKIITLIKSKIIELNDQLINDLK